LPDRTAVLSAISVLALRFLAPPTTAFMLCHWAIALAAGRDVPLRYDVRRPSRYARARQGWILKQMRRLGGTAYVARL
jgi:hypothetical protein